jgi:hypothetical protein
MRQDLPRGTVTFLFTDIEGSTRLLRRLGPELYADALAAHRQTLRDALAAEGGVEIDTQGDAFFVAFPTASGAAIAARSGQLALTPGPITVRIGLHTGTPTAAAEGYVGIDEPRQDGDLARAIELTLESATIAGEVDWAWWQFLQLHGAAELEQQRGNLDAAERHALAALDLSLSLGNRRSIMLVATKLAVIAAERGDAERAGRLWGAIESNETAGACPRVGGQPQGVRSSRSARGWTAICPGASGGPSAVNRRSGRPRLAPAGLTRVAAHTIGFRQYFLHG